MQVYQKVKLRRRQLWQHIRLCLLALCLWLAGSATEVVAQQEGNQLTQFMFSTYAYNPGFAGMSNGINALLLYRLQWAGWGNVGGKEEEKSNADGLGSGSGASATVGSDSKDKTSIAPYSIVALADMPIKAIHGAVGLEVTSYKAAEWQNTFIKLGYTYHLQTSFGLIGMGVRGQIESKGVDFNHFDPEDKSDPLLIAKQEDKNAIYGDVGVGFFLQGNGGYTVGIGFNNLISHTNEKLAYKPSRTMVVHGSYSFGFKNLPKVEFMPCTYLETDFHLVNWKIGLLATFNKRFWAGLEYRLGDAVCILAGVNIARLQIGVSYDITASSRIRASKMGGSMEAVVRYCFGLEGEKVNTEYKNARYL